jgi:hypothetical protein
MNWSKIWFVVSLLGVASLIFALGFSFGNRIWFSNSTPTTVTTTHWNGAISTVLESIKSVTLFARSSESEIKSVGQLVFVTQANQTQIILKVDSMPINFSLVDRQIATPKNLKIYRVLKTSDGTDYQTQQVGIITLEQVGSSLMGSFSTLLTTQKPQSAIERFVLLSESGTSDLPASPVLDFLPAKQQLQNAPYSWSDGLDKAK